MLGSLVNPSALTTVIVKLMVSDVYPLRDAIMVMSNSPEDVGVPETVEPLTSSQSAPLTLMVHPETLVETFSENSCPVMIVTSPWSRIRRKHRSG